MSIASHANPDARPSPWVTHHARQIVASGRVFDVACGAGRHARWLGAQGFLVDAVDIDIVSFTDVPDGVNLIAADLENAPWPAALQSNSYDGVVVTNYLWRPRLPEIFATLKVGGVLIYETFAAGNEQYGKPTRADFLLKRGELLDVAQQGFEVIAYEDTFTQVPKPAMVQRICARKVR
jgi:SAM-dependent methyltransferase